MSDSTTINNTLASPIGSLASSPGSTLASQSDSPRARLSASSGFGFASASAWFEIYQNEPEKAPATQLLSISDNPDHLEIDTSSLEEHSHFSDDSTDSMEDYDIVSGASSPSSLSFQIVEPEREKLYPIAITVFVGSPRAQKDRPVHLSCIVLTSDWRQDFFPNSCKNKADKAVKCKDIIKYNEQCLPQIAKFACAICSEPTPARKFVHQPIMFTRTSKSGLEDGPRRRLIMRLGQLVHSRWRFPDMNATLGGSAEAQVFEVAIPVCKRSGCGIAGRTSAHQLIRAIVSSNADLDPSALDLDIVIPLADLGTGIGDWTPDRAEILVTKLGPDCVPLEVRSHVEA
ncbi:hypothetical protein AtubIFM55763_009642 [Aspergillus tubingensis]|uniref:Uncharacterized protein n=2 Tax=Aspergillus subgen. Circumdati TaxID=2720871 RepID=A0A8H3SUD2_ASPTU|nr:similar to An02g13660 [Aspergillus tubingensis]GAQ46070.1 similar to An02g13660 [Aspergillus niger]GFN15058.1 similar to An02g13660 [Aspergillus tubingensis]GLA62718.1 hypothetical protein AtubIFM54640_003848 [Aspergillus tubingensis]GLA77455.1 hypothetical protein AtubIFM55763_009642 [Aspergillus tubingensis]GLA83055.1 hypothetical protein AtubIFM56815_007246 [Aspergillus tubingensis]